MVNSSIENLTYHHNSLNIPKTTTYDIGDPLSGSAQAQKCGKVKPNNGIPTLYLF